MPQGNHKPNTESLDPGVYIFRANQGTIEKATFGELQGARVGSMNEDVGSGQEWAPSVYGKYPATSTPAYRATNLRANALASAPLVVKRHLTNGESESLPNHPLQMLLNHVNPFWSYVDLMRATELYLSIWGSVFWFIERENPRNPASMPVNIWPLRPDKMKIFPGRPAKGQSQFSANNYISGYQFTNDQEKVSFLPHEIVWFRYINPMEEFAGLAPIAPIRLTLDMGKDAILFNRKFFSNGAMPGDVVFMVEGPVGPDEAEAFYDRLEARFQGANNAHRPMLWDMDKGKGPTRLGINQKDMEFLGSLDFTTEESSRVWGVPPPLMMSQKTSTYNNVREARIIFYSGTISEEWRFVASEINEGLVPLYNDPSLFVEFDTSNILPLAEARLEVDKQELEEVKIGTLTINEFRRARGREEVAWGDEPPSQSGSQIAPNDDEEIDEDEQDDIRSFRLSPKTFENEKVIESIFKAFDDQLENASVNFKALQKRLFAKQIAQVYRMLASAQRDELTIIEESANMAITKGGETIFNVNFWNEEFIREGSPLIRNLLIFAANQQADLFGLGAIDILAPSIAEWTEDRAAFWATRVNSETAELLVQEIQAGIAEGESITEISSRVQKVEAFNNAVRAEKIARTESLSAMNSGHLELYKQNPSIDRKMWLTTLDGRERDSHRAANRQTVSIEDEFIVQGERLRAPGVGGSASNVINCRCTVVPIIKTNSQRSKEPKSADVALLEAIETLSSRFEQALSDKDSKRRVVRKKIINDDKGIPIEVIETEEFE